MSASLSDPFSDLSMKDEALRCAKWGLDIRLKRLERALPKQEDGPAGSKAPDGHRYHELVPQSRRKFKTANQAIDWLIDVICNYCAAAHGDTLWWRERPDIIYHPGGWMVYARLRVGFRE